MKHRRILPSALLAMVGYCLMVAHADTTYKETVGSGVNLVRSGKILQRSMSNMDACWDAVAADAEAQKKTTGVTYECDPVGTKRVYVWRKPVPVPPVTWTRAANERLTFRLYKQATVRFGIGDKWVQKTLGPGEYGCGFQPAHIPNPAFDSEPVGTEGVAKVCEADDAIALIPPVVTIPPVVEVTPEPETPLIPRNPSPFNTLRVRQVTTEEKAASADWTPAPEPRRSEIRSLHQQSVLRWSRRERGPLLPFVLPLLAHGYYPSRNPRRPARSVRDFLNVRHRSDSVDCIVGPPHVDQIRVSHIAVSPETQSATVQILRFKAAAARVWHKHFRIIESTIGHQNVVLPSPVKVAWQSLFAFKQLLSHAS